MPLLYDFGDPGITSFSYIRNYPGENYTPSGTHMTAGDTRFPQFKGYEGYSFRALGQMRKRERQRNTTRVGPTAKRMGTTQMESPSTSRAPSRRNPKRLWEYQLASIAPSHTTLGRMRTLYGGFGSPIFR